MYFFTSTILNWQNLLLDDKAKDIIVNSFQHLSETKQTIIHGFVIMPNHIHILLTVPEPNVYDIVINSFIRFTGHEFKKFIKKHYPDKLYEYTSTQADRDFHFWERRPRSIKVENEKIAWQKLDYIHSNPTKAGLCIYPEDYIYSSASFYSKQSTPFLFLVHHSEY